MKIGKMQVSKEVFNDEMFRNACNKLDIFVLDITHIIYNETTIIFFESPYILETREGTEPLEYEITVSTSGYTIDVKEIHENYEV